MGKQTEKEKTLEKLAAQGEKKRGDTIVEEKQDVLVSQNSVDHQNTFVGKTLAALDKIPQHELDKMEKEKKKKEEAEKKKEEKRKTDRKLLESLFGGGGAKSAKSGAKKEASSKDADAKKNASINSFLNAKTNARNNPAALKKNKSQIPKPAAKKKNLAKPTETKKPVAQKPSIVTTTSGNCNNNDNNSQNYQQSFNQQDTNENQRTTSNAGIFSGGAIYQHMSSGQQQNSNQQQSSGSNNRSSPSNNRSSNNSSSNNNNFNNNNPPPNPRSHMHRMQNRANDIISNKGVFEVRWAEPVVRRVGAMDSQLQKIEFYAKINQLQQGLFSVDFKKINDLENLSLENLARQNVEYLCLQRPTNNSNTIHSSKPHGGHFLLWFMEVCTLHNMQRIALWKIVKGEKIEEEKKLLAEELMIFERSYLKDCRERNVVEKRNMKSSSEIPMNTLSSNTGKDTPCQVKPVLFAHKYNADSVVYRIVRGPWDDDENLEEGGNESGNKRERMMTTKIGLARTKFHVIAGETALRLLQTDAVGEMELPLALSSKEQSLVSKALQDILLFQGRSGSGKTTVLLMIAVMIFRAYHEEKKDEEKKEKKEEQELTWLNNNSDENGDASTAGGNGCGSANDANVHKNTSKDATNNKDTTNKDPVVIIVTAAPSLAKSIQELFRKLLKCFDSSMPDEWQSMTAEQLTAEYMELQEKRNCGGNRDEADLGKNKFNKNSTAHQLALISGGDGHGSKKKKK